MITASAANGARSRTPPTIPSPPCAGPLPWRSWERSEDYYSEGQLMWLDADTLIREKSGGKRSLDDFARAFFGVNDGSFVTSDTIEFEDVVKALNAVQPYDWATFLRARLDGHGPGAPLDGIARGGYKLVYTDTPSDYFKDSEARRKITDLTYSLGMIVAAEGQPRRRAVGRPRLQDRPDRRHSDHCREWSRHTTPTGSRRAIKDAKQIASAAIELLVKNGDRFRTVKIDYHDGLRYPHLEREENTPARLDQILTPRN